MIKVRLLTKDNALVWEGPIGHPESHRQPDKITFRGREFTILDVGNVHAFACDVFDYMEVTIFHLEA